jgi:hypothetical protein
LAARGHTTIQGDGITWPDQEFGEIVYDAPLAINEVDFSAQAGKKYTGPIATFTDLNPYATAGDFLVSEWSVGSITYFPDQPGPVSNVHFERTGGGFTLYATIDFGGFLPGRTTVYAGVWDANVPAPYPHGGAIVEDAVRLTGPSRPHYTTTVSGRVLQPVIGQQASGELFAVSTTDPAITPANLTVESGSPAVLIGSVSETRLPGGVDVFAVNGAVHSSPADCGPVVVPVTVRTPEGPLHGYVGYTPTDFGVEGLTVSAAEGQAVEGVPVAIISSPATATAGGYAATVSWGDGETSPGVLSPLGDGRFGVTASKPTPYQEAGTYPVTVSVTGPGDDPPAPATGSAVVADGALRGQGENGLQGEVGVEQDGVVLAVFQDLGTPEPPAEYTAQVYWGAGRAAPEAGQVCLLASDQGAPGGGRWLEVVGDWTPARPGPVAGRVVVAEGEAETTIPFTGGVAPVRVLPTQAAPQANGSVVVTYRVTGRLAAGQAAPISVYWAGGPTGADAIRRPKSHTATALYTFNATRANSSPTTANHFTVPAANLTVAPKEATYLLVVADPAKNLGAGGDPQAVLALQAHTDDLTWKQLQKVMPGLPDASAQNYVGPLNQAMTQFGIRTLEQRAMFLAQLASESTYLVQWSENPQGDPDTYFIKKYWLARGQWDGLFDSVPTTHGITLKVRGATARVNAHFPRGK